MHISLSKPGVILSAVYLLICVALIFSQGLFGESFIALILGMPWTLMLASIEFGNVSGALLYILILLPIAINALLLYWIGAFFGRKKA